MRARSAFFAMAQHTGGAMGRSTVITRLAARTSSRGYTVAAHAEMTTPSFAPSTSTTTTIVCKPSTGET